MRKAFFSVVILALCLSLWGCASPDTFAAAVEISEEKLQEWNAENYNSFEYSYTYPNSREAFTVIMRPDASLPTYTAEETKAAAKEIYQDISWYFSSLDTAVVIAIMSPEDELLHVYTKSDF